MTTVTLTSTGQLTQPRLDTNVIVRLLIGDDPQQTTIAKRAFLAAIASGGIYLPVPSSNRWAAGSSCLAMAE